MTEVTHTSEKGLNVTRSFEGCALRAYPDPIGVWTIGIGITNYDAGFTAKYGKVQRGLTITEQQAEDAFRDAISNRYEPSVRKALPDVPQPAFDAGTSFHYNTGAIARASWPKAFLAKSMDACRAGIMAWNHAGGKVLAGLTRRRNREWLMVSAGDYGPEGAGIMQEIGENGRPTGRTIGANHATTAPLEKQGRVVPIGEGMLKHGDTGPAVVELNQQLTDLGYFKKLPDSAILYDDATEAAVRKLQSHHPDLTADGVFGPATRSQIMRDLDMRKKAKNVSKATVVVASTATAAKAAGWLSWHSVGLFAGTLAALGLIIIVIQHRTEIVALINRLLGRKVP